MHHTTKKNFKNVLVSTLSTNGLISMTYSKISVSAPLGTGCKLNVHKTASLTYVSNFIMCVRGGRFSQMFQTKNFFLVQKEKNTLKTSNKRAPIVEIVSWNNATLYHRFHLPQVKQDLISCIISFVCYNYSKNIWDKLCFSCEIAPYGNSSISIFQKFLASIKNIFILAGRLGTSL